MKLFKRKHLKREVAKLRAEVASLKEAAERPPLFTTRDGKDTPLQPVRSKMFSEYEPLHIANQIHTACDILANDDEIHAFALCLETTEGSFYYEIEDGKRVWENNPNFFSLSLEWNPIWVGKAMTILDVFIVHRDRILQYVPAFRGVPCIVGDKIAACYKLDSSSGMRPL